MVAPRRTGVPVETDVERRMKKPYVEGVENRHGPESWGSRREHVLTSVVRGACRPAIEL